MSGSLDFLPADGEVADLIRRHDWAATTLGDPAQWSASLRMTVRFILANRFPHLLWWGPDYVQIYNDAYIPVLGAKHPQQALGKPLRECWHEIFHILQPLVDTPFNGGPASWTEDTELVVRRKNFPEESHFIFAYSPVPDDTAPRGIGGVIATVHEITEKVITERRVKILSELGAEVVGVRTEEQACRQTLDIFARHPKDIPFALIYLFEEEKRQLKLVGTTGVPAASVGPSFFNEGSELDAAALPLAEALRTETTQLRTGLAALLPEVPSGPWEDAPDTVAVIPVRSNMAGRPAGVLVVGLSAYIQPDSHYMDFLNLLSAQVATAVANARAYEIERRRAEALAEIDHAKTMFFSNVSHEFRTPLTLMLGPLQDVLENPELPAGIHTRLDIAQRNAQRLLKLVNSLLDFSRMEAGRIQAAFVAVDLAKLTTDLASTFRSAMERAGLAFSVDCPALEQPVHVDRDLWEKVVLNLLSNAFKFTLEGSIRVHQFSDGTHVFLEISDTGVGVPADEIPRLFDRFHRVEGSKARTYEGSGIGLALVHEIVTLHGGTVDVRSEPGRGSTFRVRIPFGVRHLASANVRSSPPASTTTTSNAYVHEALRWLPEQDQTPARNDDGLVLSHDRRFASTFGSRVLIADDNADMRRYLRDLLSPRYVVDVASDGTEALDASIRMTPDLILCDVMMPNMNGFEFLATLRADAHLAEVPVILLSARAGEEASVEGLEAGADDYIVKPFQAQELLARVGAALELTTLRRENARRFQAYIEASSDVIYRMNADWSEMYFLRGRNFIADQLQTSQTWLEKYILVEDRPQVWAAIQQAIRNKSIFELEHRVKRADGSVGWTFSRAIPLLDDGGDITEWFGAAADVTTRRETSEALSQQRMQLQDADRQKNEFLAMLAHELRNPLAPIRNAAELLSRLTAGNTSARQMVDIVQRQVTHLTHLVDDLLDISRITQNRIELERETVEVAEIVRHAVETVETMISDRSHDLQIQSSYRALYVNGDVSRLVQCVVNLLTNAVKYTEPGGSIHIITREKNGSALIEVVDNGMGVSPELLPRLFDLFVQSERTLARSQGGLGVGLSVVKRLIEMHGGEVSAESAGPAYGSKFSIRLPLVEASSAKTQATSPDGVPKQRILVVDDNIDAGDTLGMLLSFDGHETVTAYNASEALARIKSFQPDVVLLDIGLPDMDGYEVIRRINTMPEAKGTKVVALTGYGQPEDKARSAQEGFYGHLVKPVDPEELRNILARQRA